MDLQISANVPLIQPFNVIRGPLLNSMPNYNSVITYFKNINRQTTSLIVKHSVHRVKLY